MPNAQCLMSHVSCPLPFLTRSARRLPLAACRFSLPQLPVSMYPQRMIDSLQRPVVAIHQPNFMPWPGWFAKAILSDTLILLDDVQYPKNSWVNRVQICADNRPFWITIPVNVHMGQKISAVRVFKKIWAQKACKALDVTYRRAPFFETYRDPLHKLLLYDTDSLVELNEPLLRYLIECLGGTCQILRSSSLSLTGEADKRLIQAVQAVDGKTYLSGMGGCKYQDPALFREAELNLQLLRIKPLEYPQRGEVFRPGLSIVDLLFHLGPASRDWLLQAIELLSPEDPSADDNGGT